MKDSDTPSLQNSAVSFGKFEQLSVESTAIEWAIFDTLQF